jgi:hypothetical protein
LPDYADVLIAAVSATLAAAVLRLVSRPRQLATRAAGAPWSAFDRAPRAAIALEPSAPGPAGVATRAATITTTAASSAARFAGLALLIVVGWSVFDFPVGSWLLALGLIGYAALVRRFPTASYLVALPALLPVLDLAPWSGRFFWDEFDLLLAVTLGMKLLLPRPLPQAHLRVSLPATALGLLALSVAASAVLALWPPAPAEANALSSYLSPYNALRIAKGYAWGGAVLWLVCRDAAAGRRVVPALHAGLVAALLAAAVSVYWERLSFLGAFDPGSAFRAAGLVSATHVGGAYLEALLVMLAPFSLALAFTAERRLLRAFGYASALLGAAAIVFTLSRAAAAAWVAAIAVFAVVLWLRSTSARAGFGSGWRRWGAGLAVAGLFGATVLVAQSSQLRERLVLSEADLALRISHWRQTLRIARVDPLHLALGMGLGAFPREFYVADAATQRLPAYRLERDAASGRRSLVLAGGRGMFIDQRVAAPAGSELHLRGVIRSPQGSGKLAVSLCRKSMLNSVACDEAVVSASPSWQPFDVRLAVPPRAGLSMGPAAPVALSLHNATFGSRVEVTQLSLAGAEGEWLRNGSFEQGLDRWFVTSDVHLAWRVLNTPLQVAFEQGALGVLAWLALGVAALAAVVRSVGSPGATAAFAAAVAGFLAVGLFDSLLDSPRMIVLLALVAAAGAQLGQRSQFRASLEVRLAAHAERPRA